MLIVKEDIFIIDFEGEPRRTLAERRMKAPAARDVAGLIRSIDYSVSAALERSLKVKADDQRPAADRARAVARRKHPHIPDAYRAAMTDERLWPSDPAAADNLLQLLPAGEGVLRNRVRTGAPAGLAAGRAERRAACAAEKARPA